MPITIKELGLKHGSYDCWYKEFDDYTLSDPKQLARLIHHCRVLQLWTIWAQLIRQAPLLDGLQQDSAYQFYQALQCPKNILFSFLVRSDQPTLKLLSSDAGFVALAYLFGGLEATEYVLSRPDAPLGIDEQSKLLSWAAQHGHLELVIRLIKIPGLMTRTGLFDELLLIAAKGRHLAVLSYLLELPTTLQAHAKTHRKILLSAVENDHLAMVTYLVEPQLILRVSVSDLNHALRLAVKQGYLGLVKCLLEIPTVMNLAGKGQLLGLAAQNQHYTITNYLLEHSEIRQSRMWWNTTTEAAVIASGLKRALWLELAKLNGFDQIKDLAELQSFCARYLAENLFFMNHMSPITLEELQYSLSWQVLSLRYYGYFDHSALEDCHLLPGRVITAIMLGNIKQFIILPESLKHFIEQPSLLKPALSCLKHWTMMAHKKIIPSELVDCENNEASPQDNRASRLRRKLSNR